MNTQKEVILCLALTCAAVAQTASISFEVASINPTVAASGEQLSVGMSRDPARVSYSGVTLKNLVSQAYRVKDYQVTGPDWLDSDRFDLNAKIPDGVDIRQVPAMLQTLLAERFKLTLHRDTKVMPAYALVVAKGGSKLTKTEESSGDVRMMIGSKGRQVSGKVTIAVFSAALSTWMDRPVVDMTGMKDVYDLELRWSGDEGPSDLRKGHVQPDGINASANEEGEAEPSLFAAIQKKLGLRLESRKLAVEILVVDYAKRVPVGN